MASDPRLKLRALRLKVEALRTAQDRQDRMREAFAMRFAAWLMTHCSASSGGTIASVPGLNTAHPGAVRDRVCVRILSRFQN